MSGSRHFWGNLVVFKWIRAVQDDEEGILAKIWRKKKNPTVIIPLVYLPPPLLSPRSREWAVGGSGVEGLSLVCLTHWSFFRLRGFLESGLKHDSIISVAPNCCILITARRRYCSWASGQICSLTFFFFSCLLFCLYILFKQINFQECPNFFFLSDFRLMFWCNLFAVINWLVLS